LDLSSVLRSRCLAFCPHSASQGDDDVYAMINVFWEKLESRTDSHGCSSTTHGVVPTLQVIGNTFSFSFEKAALYLRFEQLKNRAGKFGVVERPGTRQDVSCCSWIAISCLRIPVICWSYV
jgi:hypothetical protein